MTNAININLPTTPSVDAVQDATKSIVATTEGKNLKQKDNDFSRVLNNEIKAQADVESSDNFTAVSLNVFQKAENVNNIDETTSLDLPQLVSSDGIVQPEAIQLTSLVEPISTEEPDALQQELVLEFQQALQELPEEITALPLTVDNKINIAQQALAIVEQKNPELLLKLQQQNGQQLPIKGILLPLVDEMSIDTPLPLSEAGTLKQTIPVVLPIKEGVFAAKEEASLDAADELEAEMSFKDLLSTKNSDGETKKSILNDFINSGQKNKEVPVQKITTEAILTSTNNILSTNQVSVNSASAAAVQSSTTLLLPQNPSPAQWGSALGDKVQWMINAKMNSADIRIDPPHLGKIEISIKMTDDGTQVSINTQLAATKELVDAASFRLKEMLEQAGHQQVDVDVSHKDNNQADNQMAQNDDLNEQTAATNAENQDAQELTNAHMMAETYINGRPTLDLFV